MGRAFDNAEYAVDAKNYIINGAMMVSQQNGTTAGTVTTYYGVDQFAANLNTGAYSVAQVASATAAGSPNRLRMTVTTADAAVAAGDIVYIEQKLEGLRVADLLFGTASARSVVVRFGCKAPAGTYSLVLLNGASNRSYAAEYTISAGEANTDVVKTVTIPGDTSGTWLKDTGIGMFVRWGLMAGSTFAQAAGSWGTTNTVGSTNQFNFMGTLSNVFELFDVGLYVVGAVPPAFVVPFFDDELIRCMRYYEKSHNLADPLVGATSNFLEQYVTVGIGSYQTTSIQFKVRKRTSVTMSFYPSNGGAAGNVFAVVAAAAKTASPDGQNEYSFSMFLSGMTGSDLIRFNFAADARL